MKKMLLLFALIIAPAIAWCCDCAPAYNARGFCTVVSEAKSRPMFCVVKATVTSYYAWGMYVRVLDNIYNTASSDTILVWGDNGACCRPTFTGWAAINIGDTLVMSLEQTDFMGNWIAPGLPDLEDSSDYVLNGCGSYYLRYKEGKVYGGLTSYTSTDTMDYEAFRHFTLGCLNPAAVPGPPLQIRTQVYPNPSSGMISILSAAVISELSLLNSVGQRILHHYPNSKIADLDMVQFPAGVYTLILYDERKTASRHKIVRQ